MKIKGLTFIFFLACAGLFCLPQKSFSQETNEKLGVFDDTNILDGYTKEYQDEPKEAIIGRINDDTINVYQSAAAIRVFKENFSQNVFGHEKLLIEQDLVRRINRTNSPFVETEIMHTLCLLDRYRYFDAMVPALILKLDHYNGAVNEMAAAALDDIIAKGKGSARDARIIFNTLRKVFFLSRNTFKSITEPDQRLSKKLKLLRWSVKVLGAQEVKKLPKEMMHLL
ncbi:MAG: hypothetical protein IT395_07765 [Candidatus Omnitrophica bacterium]|nr:hypothetical protein [Candidatus Omnitrophota bacterium]